MSNTRNKPVALVTGGATRIGAAIVKALHAADYCVVIHYCHSLVLAKQLEQFCNSEAPDRARIIPADLHQFDRAKFLVETAAATWGRLDVLVNNASLFYPTPVGQALEKDWEQLIRLNLMAPYFLSQQAYPYLKNTNGCIINISDIKAECPLRHYDIYCISKTGLNMLTRTSALEFAPSVRVNAVAPGPTLWPKDPENQLSDKKKQEIIDRIPLQKTAAVDDIAKTVLFLTQNKHITGQIIAVDGGQSL